MLISIVCFEINGYVNFVYVENAVDNVDGAFSIIIKSSRAASVSGFRLNLSQFPLKF